MRLLLDTHILLWWLSDDRKLPREVRRILTSGRALVMVSAASVWELAIKCAHGRLEIPSDLLDEIEAQGFTRLPITFENAITAGGLPDYHRDQFDRMLIAQALSEELTIATVDPRIHRYGVAVVPG